MLFGGLRAMPGHAAWSTPTFSKSLAISRQVAAKSTGASLKLHDWRAFQLDLPRKSAPNGDVAVFMLLARQTETESRLCQAKKAALALSSISTPVTFAF